jgi:hypothetical protein
LQGVPSLRGTTHTTALTTILHVRPHLHVHVHISLDLHIHIHMGLPLHLSMHPHPCLQHLH